MNDDYYHPMNPTNADADPDIARCDKGLKFILNPFILYSLYNAHIAACYGLLRKPTNDALVAVIDVPQSTTTSADAPVDASVNTEIEYEHFAPTIPSYLMPPFFLNVLFLNDLRLNVFL